MGPGILPGPAFLGSKRFHKMCTRLEARDPSGLCASSGQTLDSARDASTGKVEENSVHPWHRCAGRRGRNKRHVGPGDAVVPAELVFVKEAPCVSQG